MVFQSYALYPHKSVGENIAYPLRIRKLGKDDREQRVAKVAEMLSITPLLDRMPRQLSGGQRQRVALARAIVREPRAFLMDEPLSNLDAQLRLQMRVEIKRLQRELGITTLYVTHDQVEAMTMADLVAVMHDGRAPAAGSAERAVRPPGQPVRRPLLRLAAHERAVAATSPAASSGIPRATSRWAAPTAAGRSRSASARSTPRWSSPARPAPSPPRSTSSSRSATRR